MVRGPTLTRDLSVIVVMKLGLLMILKYSLRF
jgi:hypothetical protein